ncbi:MAG TPA: hypothetical protein VJR29_00605 [bacterium]|nr:hypothetical protein [bacterium]
MLASAAGAFAQGRVEAAADLYSELGREAVFPASIRERAHARWAALRGEGRLGDRAEAFASRFLQEAADPAALFAMTVAGAAFRLTRFLSLARLGGSRILAGAAGFGVEATVFPLAHRLGDRSLGRELEWNHSVLGREWASSFLVLGALRTGGLLTGALAPRSGLLGIGLRQGGLFGGILLAHELEARAGLRERLHGSNLLIDSLATLLHFQVGARLSRSLLGESWRHWERSLARRSSALERISVSPNLTTLLPQPAWASSFWEPLFMSGNNDEGGRGPRNRPDNVVSLEEFRRRRQPGPTQNRSELGEAIRHWMAHDPTRADREIHTIEQRLEAHPPAFRDLIAYLAAHHPLAARLLMRRHDLLAADSPFRHHPMLRDDPWITDFYSHDELVDIYERIWLRYVQRLRYDEAHFSLYDVPMSSPEFFENLKRTHPALVAALIHPGLPAEIFMPLIQSLEIFPAPRSPE